MLTLKQHRLLRELKKKYAYELAEQSENPDLQDDRDVLLTLLTYQFDQQLSSSINQLAENMPEDEAIRLLCGIFAKSAGQMMQIYDKKYKGYKGLRKLFDAVIDEAVRSNNEA